MTPTRNPVTRDIIGPLVYIPHGCITAHDLRSLADTLDRINGFHKKAGGRGDDNPCLVEVLVENDKHIHARVHSGDRVYRLSLIDSEWKFQ